MPKTVRLSRPKQWADACARALSGLEDLVSLQEEYQAWNDNLPENLQQAAIGDKLTTICDLDLEGVLEAVREAEGANLPLGFGRD